MASEELFQNDYSEEQDLGQDFQKSDAINMDTAQNDADNTDTGPQNETKKSSSAGSPTQTISEQTKTSNGNKALDHDHDAKLTQLPMGRVRNLMKLDPDLQIASNEAVFTVTRAVELFVESLARESYTYTAQGKKKTVQKRDVELAISAVDSLMFLDGALNF